MSQNEIRESIEGSDLPLEYTFKINEGDGVKKVDATVKRGLLSITFGAQLDELGVTKGPSAEVRFKYLARFLRAALQNAGYPSDVEYVWISVAGGEWRYDQNHEDDLGEQPYELRSWHDQLVAMTEPLSRYRLIGDLLHMIDQLLRQNQGPRQRCHRAPGPFVDKNAQKAHCGGGGSKVHKGCGQEGASRAAERAT